MEEEWKQLDDTKYQVSNLGRVRSSKTHRGWVRKDGAPEWKVLKPGLSGVGYHTYAIDGVTTNVHTLVAHLFLPPPTEEQTQIDHIDRNRANSVVSNLRWCTPRENLFNKPKHTDPMYSITACAYDTSRFRVQVPAAEAGKTVHLGVFKTVEEAQAARDAYLLDGTMPPPRRDPDLVGICQIKKTGRWKVAFRKHGLIEYHGEFATVEEAKAKRNEVRPLHPAA